MSNLLSSRRYLKVGVVRGIEIRLDFSVAIIFGLIVFSLGTSVFPEWHEEWGAGMIWGTSIAAGICLFASLLAHELAHSIVAQMRGITVPRITLFLFGGVSEMEREPDSPITEVLIAAVGPAMSIALGVVCMILGFGLADESFALEIYTDSERAMTTLGPVATVLLWLAPVNLILGIFNLIPGFPLDGGRVYRAAVWWFTGDLERATRAASNAGSGVAIALMVVGVLQILQGVLLGGLWLILIGWFLYGASRAGYTQLVLRRTVENLKVSDLMRTHFEVVQQSLPLGFFLKERLFRSAQTAWPVVNGDQLVGILSFDDTRRFLRNEIDPNQVTVADAMQPIERSVGSEMAADAALKTLLNSEHDPLTVVDDDKVVGLLYRADIMRWLALHRLNSARS